jgi:hypothetical protein
MGGSLTIKKESVDIAILVRLLTSNSRSTLPDLLGAAHPSHSGASLHGHSTFSFQKGIRTIYPINFVKSL